MRSLFPRHYHTAYEYEDGTPVESDWWMWRGYVFRHRLTVAAR